VRSVPFGGGESSIHLWDWLDLLFEFRFGLLIPLVNKNQINFFSSFRSKGDDGKYHSMMI
jgi:hypothetical protein